MKKTEKNKKEICSPALIRKPLQSQLP